MLQFTLFLSAVASVASATLQRTGPFSTTTNIIQDANYRFTEAIVSFPSAATTSNSFPLIVFGHGLGGDPKYYSEITRNVASHGYIVVSPRSCPTLFCPDFYLDLISVLDWASKESINVTSIIDQSQGTGVFGHSMGSLATYKASSSNFTEKYNIKGVVPLHPGIIVHELGGNILDQPIPASPTGQEPSVPILMITGSNDTTITASTCKDLFSQTVFPQKAFINIAGIQHTEPSDLPGGLRIEDAIVAGFFDCVIKEKSDACENIRNQGDGGVCSSFLEGRVEECIVQL